WGVNVVDIAQRKVVAKVLPWKSNTAVAVASKLGRYFVADYYSSELNVMDSDSNLLKETIDLNGAPTPYGIVVDSSQQKAYVSNGYSGGIFAVDLNARSVIKKIPTTSISHRHRPATEFFRFRSINGRGINGANR
ncbi:MAG: hypothetical protein IH908_14005, partial [Proteobacteria bacterium]|nr:hypothetical protein [Pseudomonadota bacterium]